MISLKKKSSKSLKKTKINPIIKKDLSYSLNIKKYKKSRKLKLLEFLTPNNKPNKKIISMIKIKKNEKKRLILNNSNSISHIKKRLNYLNLKTNLKIRNLKQNSMIGNFNYSLLNKTENYITKIKKKNFQKNLSNSQNKILFYKIKKNEYKFIIKKKIQFPKDINKVILNIDTDMNKFPICVEIEPFYLKIEILVFFNDEKIFFKKFNHLKFEIKKKEFLKVKNVVLKLNLLNNDYMKLKINFFKESILKRRNFGKFIL